MHSEGQRVFLIVKRNVLSFKRQALIEYISKHSNCLLDEL